mgnify:CR=1 FL=1
MADMNRFIHDENLRLLRHQLARTTNQAMCRQIMRLIEDEELKDCEAAHNDTGARA